MMKALSGAFAKFAQSDYYLNHVCPSAWNNSVPRIHSICYLKISRKFAEKIQVSFKYDKNCGYFTWTPIYTYIHDHISLNCFSNEKIFGQNVYRKSLTHTKCSITSFNLVVYKMWKYCKASQATDENKVHAICMLDT
jgi:hypothetical protein